MSKSWYTIHTDGGMNNQTAYWAFIIKNPDHSILEKKAGRIPITEKTTINRMEMIAAIMALRRVPKNSLINLNSDSQYLIFTLTQNWKRRTNYDLWNLLEDAIRSHQAVFLNWIPREQNSECDLLARNAKIPGTNNGTNNHSIPTNV